MTLEVPVVVTYIFQWFLTIGPSDGSDESHCRVWSPEPNLGGGGGGSLLSDHQASDKVRDQVVEESHN